MNKLLMCNDAEIMPSAINWRDVSLDLSVFFFSASARYRLMDCCLLLAPQHWFVDVGVSISMMGVMTEQNENMKKLYGEN